MKRASWMYSCLAILVVAASAHGTTFFVDAAGGADTNTGLSAATPFATIQWAVDQAAANPGPDLIQIAAGEYRENIVIADPDKLMLSGTGGVAVAAPDNTRNGITVYSGDAGRDAEASVPPASSAAERRPIQIPAIWDR